MQAATTTWKQVTDKKTSELDEELSEALRLLYPGTLAESCLRLDRLSSWEVRQAYDCRVRDLHPGWGEKLSEEELVNREKVFHQMTAAYLKLLTYVRQRERFEVSVPAGPEFSDLAKTEEWTESDKQQQSLVLAVAGAKKNVGTTFLTSLISSAMTGAGYSSLAVDLDGEGQPLCSWLGASSADSSIERLIQRPERGVGDLETYTDLDGLTTLGGCHTAADVRLLSRQARIRFQKALQTGDHKFTALDLGSADGTGHMDLFAGSDLRLLVTTPDQHSLLEAYRFLDRNVRRLLYRYYVVRTKEHSRERSWFEHFFNVKKEDGTNLTPRWLLSILHKENSAMYREVSGLIRAGWIDLVVNHNRARGNTPGVVRFLALVKNNLDVNIREIHSIPDDRKVYAAIGRGEPTVLDLLKSKSARAVYHLVQKTFFVENPEMVTAIRDRLTGKQVVRERFDMAAIAGKKSGHRPLGRASIQ